MPKAYDVKHNYYADLELPTSASCEEVKKQYRKLALQYHPDRNAGKEEEYIPKFQAIQAAHEILGEPAEKNKYDGDRRKAGLYPSSGFGASGFSASAATGARGNPYQATSNYPPPPRRTQPGTWQRPQATQTGADRFSHNFPRQAPTAKKPDPTAERQNAYRAWQNMNNAQDRQQHQSRFSQSTSQPQSKTSTPRRPAPPPRASDPKFPSDEKIRAGFNYREAPQSTTAEQSAYAYQKAQSPGVKRSNTNKTPKKQGFDPNAPGSDEGPAPDSQYAHRHKSADFGRPSFAPPPPPPRPSQPDSPSPAPQRPHADPLRPFKSRSGDEDAPYSEGNRVRTPYSSFSGERTDFGGDMRRSNSTRDTFRMHPGSSDSRARSTSPLRRQSEAKSDKSESQAHPNQQKPAFSVGGSSSTSPESSDPESTGQYQSPFTGKSPMPPQNRPKIVPSPPSRRFNGSTNPTSPAPNEGEMRQKSNSNMYVNPTSSSRENEKPPFSTAQWAKEIYGKASAAASSDKQYTLHIPDWAVPPSILQPRVPAAQPVDTSRGGDASPSKPALVQTVISSLSPPTLDEHNAYTCLGEFMKLLFGSLPQTYDMDAFLITTSSARSGQSTGNEMLDNIVKDTLALYPSVGYRVPATPKDPHANGKTSPDRFSFPTSPDLFSSSATSAKSRSEENINTKFAANGWSGTFSGSTDYFAPPQTSSRRQSPASRGGQRPGVRTANSGFGYPESAAQSPTTSNMPPPPPPLASKPAPDAAAMHSASGDPKFSSDQWEQTFKDDSWTRPPIPTMAPASPVKGGTRSKAASRKNSRAQKPSAATMSGTATNPHVVDEEDDETVDPSKTNGQAFGGPVNEPDAMDIDNTPPATEQPAHQQQHGDQHKEPRLVSVPPSAWRQSQQPHSSNSHHRTTSSGSGTVPLKADLNDLANVAPFAQHSDGSGLQDFSSMSSTLPFTSQAANTLPTNPNKPQTLATPIVPVAPKAPQRLTKQTWQQYAQNFGVYLLAFNSFNNDMLQHFQARNQQSVARMQTGMAWLASTGDSSDGGAGFGSYAREVREDERVRGTWKIGCDRHTDAVKEFDEVREKVRRLASAGGIAEQ
ncbi:hypothetical protein Q7P37_005821 [Cladosporium fusiforme]